MPLQCGPDVLLNLSVHSRKVEMISNSMFRGPLNTQVTCSVAFQHARAESQMHPNEVLPLDCRYQAVDYQAMQHFRAPERNHQLHRLDDLDLLVPKAFVATGSPSTDQACLLPYRNLLLQVSGWCPRHQCCQCLADA